MDTLIAHIMTGKDDYSFCKMLDEVGVTHTLRPPIGTSRRASGAVQIATDIPSWAAAVASVLDTWIRSSSSRKVNVTTNSIQVVSVGMTLDEIERLLRVSKSIAVIDTDP